jgi:hypothetical protein
VAEASAFLRTKQNKTKTRMHDCRLSHVLKREGKTKKLGVVCGRIKDLLPKDKAK